MNHVSCDISQHHNSPADCARELFKPSRDVARLVVWIFFKLESFRVSVLFVGDIISGIDLGLSGQGDLALGPNGKTEFLTQVFSGN